MSYKALHRKYRPETFEEVYGQQHIVKTLQNAVNNGKLAHAYLFCGPRGTGKTTIAKLLAKTINCTGEGTKPCGHCENCVDITNGSHPDVIELDGATNNGVDEIRDLIETVKYAPMQGKYKVYIIDEVHMITANAFNALLKTLEEPPEYCIFILATTDPQKVLPTIVSRCQRFDFNKLSTGLIQERIKEITAKEGIKCSDGAVRLISELADGGMRDALSILDQCIAYAQDNVTEDDVSAVYGIASTEDKLKLLDYVSERNAEDLIKAVDVLNGKGIDISRLTIDLINILKEGLVYSYSRNDEMLTRINVLQAQKLLKTLTPDQMVKFIDYLMETNARYREAVDNVSYFEVCLLKMMNDVEPKEEEAPIVEKPAKVEKKAEAKPVEKKEPVKKIKKLSDEEYFEIMCSATKSLKEQETEKWNAVLNSDDVAYGPIKNLVANSYIFADSPTKAIIVVEERTIADTINEESNLKSLEELAEKHFGYHKELVAITPDLQDYLSNYFRTHINSRKTAEKKEPEQPKHHLDEVFGPNGYDIVEG